MDAFAFQYDTSEQANPLALLNDNKAIKASKYILLSVMFWINAFRLSILILYYRQTVSFRNQLFVFIITLFKSLKICDHFRERRFFP